MAFLPKNGNIYMFGGLTATNQTLNDMWCFPTAGNKWHLVDQRGDVPDPRCGHSLNCHHDKLFLFGGLKEVTQESNEVFRFNPDTRKWDEIGNSREQGRFFRTCTLLEQSGVDGRKQTLMGPSTKLSGTFGSP